MREKLQVWTGSVALRRSHFRAEWNMREQLQVWTGSVALRRSNFTPARNLAFSSNSYSGCFKGTVSRHFRHSVFPLKGQCRVIFDPRFFHRTITPRALIHGLKPVRIWLHIRQETRFKNRQNLIPQCRWHHGIRLFWSELPFNIYFF
jgi:hypothetical protein